MDEMQSPGTNQLELATELTIAWLGNPNTRIAADEVPAFLRRMHEVVSELSGGQAEPTAEPEQPTEHIPAVSVRKSLASKDHIISLIDGKPYKTLRRHLATHGLTPDQYRARYGLKPEYPMVAESYSEARRAMAKQLGLGRKGNPATTPPGADKTAAAAPPRSRRKKAGDEG